MDIKTLVGQRCLLKVVESLYNAGDVVEYKVLRMAPSGKE